MNACTNCGTRRTESAQFCTNCGARFPATPSQADRRSVLAVFLALGAFGVFGCLLTCTILILVVEVPDPLGLALSITAAVIPAAIYSMLVLYLDRNEKEPWYFLAGAFAWGAVVAIVFSYFFNSLTGMAVASVYGMEAGEFFALAIAAPFFEEIFKGAALLVLLLLFRSHFDNVLDGIVYGALVGLGFAMTENIVYFGREYFESGIFGIGFLFVVRVVIGGLGHALYTAIIGASLGWARSQYGRGKARFVVPVVGFGLAMLLHSLWNTTAYLAGRVASDEAFLFAFVIIIVVEPLLFTMPGVVALVVIAVITSRRELAIIRHELREEVDNGVISAAEYHRISNGSVRRKASFHALSNGGPGQWFIHRRFVRLSAQLAFQKYHASRGEVGKRGLRYRSPDELRAEIARTRNQLSERHQPVRHVP